ncbi:hypothetical protein [uncultured Flavobacterium sp.]|uniref:hypothetical protein n=1 Tax=uncultured Flavobacterium sp. TaxID=165435 RepID=UPI0030EDB9F9
MKKLTYVVLILLTFSSYGQDVFEYEFDENISLNVLEETEEEDLPNGKYIRGTFENEVLTFSSSNKAKDKLAIINEEGLLKLFQGVKDGNLKSIKGKLINEEIINVHDIKVSRFKIAFSLEGQNKIIESYVFVYKNIIYTLQFMNNESEFEKFNNFRKSLLDSINFN